MTRAALRALHCGSCNGQGHESRDCPVRARDSCIFCGSTEHQRGVHCNAPHIYGRYVVCGTVDAFKRLPPHQQRQRLRNQNRRAAGGAQQEGDGATSSDAAVSDTSHGGAPLSPNTRSTRAASARARAATGAHARAAADEAAATRAELADTLACLRDSKASVQALRREVTALKAQNAALQTAGALRLGAAAAPEQQNATLPSADAAPDRSTRTHKNSAQTQILNSALFRSLQGR